MTDKNKENTNQNEQNDEQQNDVPDAMAWEAAAFKNLKEIWYDIKESAPYKGFRSSPLNPYHFGVKEVKAGSLDKARKIIREKAKVARANNKNYRAQFIYEGTRYYAERYDCTPQREYAEDNIVIRDGYDVTDRIPHNKKGELDLFAETPVVIAVNPIEGPALIGHTCMQYKDQIVNRLLPSIHTHPLYPKYNKFAEYYFVYPKQIGIDGNALYREMQKHNIRYGDKKYSPLFNNCAQNVAEVLEKVGVKDFDFFGPDFLGVSYATPGNNPFNVGIKAWCHKHGLRVRLGEMAEYDRLYGFTDVTERRTEMKKIRRRYRKSIGKDTGKGNDER